MLRVLIFLVSLGDTGRRSRGDAIREDLVIEIEIRHLIQTMAQDGWGAPRIHAELTKLGFVVSEVAVSQYMPRRPSPTR